MLRSECRGTLIWSFKINGLRNVRADNWLFIGNLARREVVHKNETLFNG